jgi:hypothetical protein
MTSILKVDTIQDQSGNNIINENADTITIGASGDTISIPAGATLTGAGAGLVWQSVQTTGFTASAGEAYPCDTTSAAFTVTLPATPSAGDQVQLVDYAGTFDTNALEIDGNGEDIEGSAVNQLLSGEREGVILTYIDSTQGWIATSGINEGTDALFPAPYSVDFLVIAGGGGSGNYGGGGAGGYRNSFSTETSGGGGSSEASLTFNPGTVYTITVGGGGAGGSTPRGVDGSNSSISGTGITTITSSGGGAGSAIASANSGGSGGGTADAGRGGVVGSGTANQGFAGALGFSDEATFTNGGGGGGAGSAGVASTSSAGGGNGGNGLSSSITGSSVGRGGGGGGTGEAGSGGVGTSGGGNGHPSSTAGAVNTGGGGGGNPGSGNAGGKGVVILRMPTANYSSTTTGSPTVGTDGTDTILTFNDSGSYTG